MRGKKLTLVISQARVPNVDLQNGRPWNLGGYLTETGGKKRRSKLVFGVHVEDEEVCYARMVRVLAMFRYLFTHYQGEQQSSS